MTCHAAANVELPIGTGQNDLGDGTRLWRAAGRLWRTATTRRFYPGKDRGRVRVGAGVAVGVVDDQVGGDVGGDLVDGAGEVNGDM